MAKSKSQRGSWIFTVPLVVMAVAYVLLIFLPTHKEIGQLRDTMKWQREFVASANPLGVRIAQTQELLATTKAVHEKWSANAPDDRGLPAVHESINRCVREAGATITRFDPQAELPLKSLRRLPLTLGASGTFPSLFSLLGRLEQLPQTVWLEDVKIEGPRKGEKNASVLVKLVIFAKNSEKLD